MTKPKCPNCGNRDDLVILDCIACGNRTMKCPKCGHVYILEKRENSSSA